MRILIAEDDVTSRLVLAGVLKKNGHEVVETVNGAEAWHTLQQADAPRLAILDWMMPEMDGLEVVRRVRALPSEQPPYLIVLTAKGEKADIVVGLESGANDYLTKPFDAGELRARVKVGCRVIEMQNALDANVKELRESEEKRRILLEKTPDPLFSCTPQGRFEYVNSAFAHEVGKPIDDIVGSNIGDIFPPEETEAYGRTLHHVCGTGKEEVIEMRIRPRAGDRWYLTTVTPVKDASGNVMSALWSSKNITERKRLETSLNEQVRFLQTLIDAIPASVYYKDAHGRYMGCNRAFEELIGQPRQAIVGKTAANLYAPRLADVLRENDQQLFQTGGTQRYETTILLPGGSQQIGMLHNATFTDSSGRIAGLVGVRLDITELKATEQSLRLSEEKLRFITNNLHVGAVMINPQMELVQINRQMRRWFPDIVEESGRWFEEEFVRKQWLPDEDSPIQEMFDTGRAKEATVPLATAEGERIFKVIFSPIYDESEQMTHTAIGLFEDVTDSLLAERELRQAQKLEAIGQLAAGIAHEINTPIQYVGDNVRFIDEAFSELASLYTILKDRLPMLAQGGDVSAFVREIEKISEQADLDFLLEEMPGTVEQTMEGVNRVATIVRAMREFSHPGSEEKVQTDINRALASTITVSRNEWKYVADVETDLAEDFPLLLCLPGELNQVFLNILVNAAHAIAETTENGKKGKGLIQVVTCSDSDWMEIRISDTGGGIPESIQGRIFDPFFTTKKVGKGTGQGLAIARSVVVDKHQGSLQFTTEAGKGTTFIIRLPLL